MTDDELTKLAEQSLENDYCSRYRTRYDEDDYCCYGFECPFYGSDAHCIGFEPYVAGFKAAYKKGGKE